MKKGFLASGLILVTCTIAFGQMDIDKSINLTGSGSNAKISGIKSVTAAQDAVSAEVLQSGNLTYALATGSGSAYAVTLSPAVSAYTAGMVVNFKANVANTSPVTINVNGLGAKTIKKDVSVDLAANDVAANQLVTVIYDGTNFQLSSRTTVNNTGGTVTQVQTGAGLTGGPITTTGTVSIPNSGVTNAMLQNSSVTVNPGTGLTGGGSVALGGSTTLSLATPVAVTNGGTGASTLTGAVIGNGTSAMTAVSAASALQYLRRNSANTAYEFGQINYSDISGVPTSLAPSGAAGGDLTGTYPNPTLAAAGTAGSYNYVTTDSKGRVISGALRTITGTTNQIGVTNGNFSGGNPTLAMDPAYSHALKSQAILTGGGTVSYVSGVLNWTARFIAICNGNGSQFSTNGYFDISVPGNGTTITGVGGMGNITASNGVAIGPWQALYYILPIGSSNGSVSTNFRIATYTAGMVVPENWILIAVNNNDDGTLRLGSGVTLYSGQTYPSGGNVYINNQNSTTQSANFIISGIGQANTSFKAPIYYDTDNGGYYLDMHSNTYLNGFQTNNTLAGWSGYNGVTQAYGHYIWPGRNDGSGAYWQQSWYLASHSSYGLYMNTGLNINGGFYSGGNIAIDNGAGWHRSYGNAGWYNGTYAGGIYMQDGTWVRVYNGKSFLVQSNIGTTAIRGDQQSSAGYAGEFNAACTGCAGIYTNGYVYSYSYNYVSTRKAKKDIEKFTDADYTSALAFMDELDFHYYKYIDEDKYYHKTHVGLIAEEAPTVITAPGKMGVAYGELGIFNAAAIKALKSKVENLESNTKSVSDMGMDNISSSQQWFTFSTDFKDKLNGEKAVVTVMSSKPGVEMVVSEVTNDGFKVETNNSNAPVAFNWMAMAKVKDSKAGAVEMGSKFKDMLQSAENDTRPIPTISKTPDAAIQDPSAPANPKPLPPPAFVEKPATTTDPAKKAEPLTRTSINESIKTVVEPGKAAQPK